MPVYIYKAATKDGQVITNRVEDTSKHSLISKLKRNGFMPISVVQGIQRKQKTVNKKKNAKNMDKRIEEIIEGDNILKKGKSMSFAKRVNMLLAKTTPIKTRDIIVFTQNFYLLKKANFNNIHALSTIIDSTENLMLRGILEDILAGVEAGETMYSTMEYYSNIFPYIYINMIKVGELSGSLTNSLEQAVKYLEESQRLNKKVKGILIPNIVQFVVLLVMLFAGTAIAIPAIQNVFDTLGTEEELLAITLWFSGVVDNIMEYWYIPVFIIAGIAAGIFLYVRTPVGKYNFHYFKYTCPIFGKLIYALDFSRLMKAVLLNVRNGTRIQDALEVSKNVVKNYVMLSMIEAAINNIIVGQSWIEPFEKSGLSSPMTTEMLKIGMQTDLTEMMEKLVEYMEIDIDNIMKKIMAVLPQVVYAIVGVLLIFFVIVVLVPCIQVYMGSFLFSAYGV